MKIHAFASIESEHLDKGELLALFPRNVTDNLDEDFMLAIEPRDNFWCYVNLEFGDRTIYHGLIAVYKKPARPDVDAPLRDDEFQSWHDEPG